MTSKTKEDLENAIRKKGWDFNEFVGFLTKFKEIVDTGKLAEFYCKILFNLRPTSRNYGFDAIDQENKKVEIKHRFYSGKTPPGMEMDLNTIDYVLYVDLDKDDLLPKQILKIKSEDIIRRTKGKRVSFKKAIKERKAELVFQG
ncbi:MAG: hypothetical protein QXV37_01410 [Candidatus Jordarchaeaceae archaeon]